MVSCEKEELAGYAGVGKGVDTPDYHTAFRIVEDDIQGEDTLQFLLDSGLFKGCEAANFI